MGSVYRRGDRLWIVYRDAHGRRQWRSTGLRVGQEREAERVLAAIEAAIEAGSAIGLDPETVTLRQWAAEWIQRRRARGVRTAGDEEARLRDHVLPVLGDERLADLRPRQIRALVHRLRRGPLAPRTVRHIYGALRACLTEAVVEDLIPSSPCVLLPGDLPPVQDADPTWRSSAVFARDELEMLISDERVPPDRRVVYALLGLAGLRWGEMAALRWRDYDPGLRPLGRLTVATSYSTRRKAMGGTKTDSVRLIPVHPTLARILDAHRAGTHPDDLICPSREGTPRSVNIGLRSLHRDLAALGLRPRRAHDLRRTFVSLARGAGAPKDLVAMITHTPRGADVIDGYTTLEWEALCGVVQAIRVELLAPSTAHVIRLGCDSAVTVGGSEDAGQRKAPEITEEIGGQIGGAYGTRTRSQGPGKRRR